jgi:5'-nucleotidase
MSELILLTNDDGVQAKGLHALATAMSCIGEIAVVAPLKNRSGVSHAISLLDPLRVFEMKPNWWVVAEGTPTDCVYLGIHELLPRRPALVVSGINGGPNLSLDVHYSGTVGGAMEGTLLGIASCAISLAEPQTGSFPLAAQFAARLAHKILNVGLPEGTLLNVNVPGGTPTQYQVTFLGNRRYAHAVHKRYDPRGTPYYWIGGEPEIIASLPGSDCDVIQRGKISVTPLTEAKLFST